MNSPTVPAAAPVTPLAAAHPVDIRHIDEAECRRFQGSVELVGRRWSAAIMLAVARGGERFSEIRASVTGISDRLLSQRLRELEDADLVERVVVPTTPVQIRYRLTERGADLMRALQPVVAWGQRWKPPLPEESARAAG